MAVTTFPTDSLTAGQHTRPVVHTPPGSRLLVVVTGHMAAGRGLDGVALVGHRIWALTNSRPDCWTDRRALMPACSAATAAAGATGLGHATSPAATVARPVT